MSPTAQETEAKKAPPPRSIQARIALALVRALTPIAGEPRAQWIVGRGYALLYLARYYLAAQYAKASLGVLWVALAPVLLVLVYFPIFRFAFHAKLSWSDAPIDYALFALGGLMVWAAVQDAIGQGTGALVYNATIVRHAPTPPAILPIVKVLGAFAGLAVGIAVLLVGLACVGLFPGARAVLLAPALALLLLATSGLALFLSIAAAYVRDVLQILPTLLAIEFFAAPIVYDPQTMTGLTGLAVRANPFTPFLALVRASLLPAAPFAWEDLGLAAAWAVGFFVLGVVTFRALESGLGDVV